jgi:hypothetical protein
MANLGACSFRAIFRSEVNSMSETKSEAFHRIAQERLGRLVKVTADSLTIFENLSNPYNYDWEVEEVDRYMVLLLGEVEKLTVGVSTHFRARHARKGQRAKRYSEAFALPSLVEQPEQLALPAPTIEAVSDAEPADSNVFSLVPQLSDQEVIDDVSRETVVSDQSEEESVSLETQEKEKVRKIRNKEKAQEAVAPDTEDDDIPAFMKRTKKSA